MILPAIEEYAIPDTSHQYLLKSGNQLLLITKNSITGVETARADVTGVAYYQGVFNQLQSETQAFIENLMQQAGH